jgi:Putative porin
MPCCGKEYLLAGGFFGGVQLSTSDNRDAATQNATFTGGYDNYNVYISRAFMGWRPTSGLTFIAGRQDNPFYTTSDFFLGVDFGLNGMVERLDLHKFINLTFGGSGSGGEPDAGGAKQPMAALPAPPNELQPSLIDGQFIFFHNNQDLNFNQGKDDAYQFETQLLTRLKLLGGKLTITEAPGIWVANSATLGTTKLLTSTETLGQTQNGIFNTATFTKGQPDPTALQAYGSIPASPGSGAGTLGSLNNFDPFPISQRDELFILSPGDITYNLGRVPIMLYWDMSYNVLGDDRFNSVYGPLYSKVTYVATSPGVTPVYSKRAQPSLEDNLAWLVGLKIGKNDRAGDFSVSGDYRRIGIDSMDPNINTDDFGMSNLNTQGFRVTAAVNLTDFLVLGFTGWFSWNLDSDLYGGYATGPFFPIASANSNQVFAVDLGLKF